MRPFIVACVAIATLSIARPASAQEPTDDKPATYTERVQVTGALERDREEAAGRSELTGDDLQSLRGVMMDDPLRAVQALPAVSATDDFYSEFSVRGSAFRHINLTVDGIASKYLMHTINDIVDGGSITMINSETLAGVAVLPGGYPQKAGRRIGAEVHLLTRDGSRDRFRGRIGLSGTSAGFVGEGPLAGGRGSWIASIRRSYLDYLIKRIDPTAGFAFGFTDVNGKLAYDLSPTHRVELLFLLGRAAFDGSEDARLNDTKTAVSRPWLAAASWRLTPRAGLSLTNRVYTTGVGFENRNPFGSALDEARFGNVGWRLDVSALAGRRTLLEFGGDAQAMQGRHTRRVSITGTSPLATLGDYTASAGAASAYAQARIELGRVIVTPGVRGDYWGMTTATTGSPWMTTSVALTNRTRLTAGTGIYRQFSEFDQAFGLNGGGTHLAPERATHLDIGIEQRLVAGMSVAVTGFVRHESNVLWPLGGETRLVGTRIIQGFFDAKWANALDGRARGTEIVLRRDAPHGLSGWAGYAFSRLRYDRPSGAESFWGNADQRHTVSLFGRYRLSDRTTFDMKYRYGSNYPVIGYLADAANPGVDPDTGGPLFYQVTSVRNTVRLPAYSRIDARADHAFTWTSRRFVLFVEVANVQNRKNLRNGPYSVDRNGRAFGVTETTLPIIPSAGFTFEF